MSTKTVSTKTVSSPPVRFRPHHFLCALGYQGKGYSPAFTANMDRIVAQGLHGPDGDAQILQVVDQTDDICAPCPHRRGALCDSQAKIARLDASHAAALQLEPGAQLSWAEAKARIRDRVQPGDLAQVCAGCQWLEFGMCETALSRLHAGDPASDDT